MKTIGLIGGVSWHSTIEYYRIINERISAALGGYHSAKMIINSVDFEGLVRCASQGDWASIESDLITARKSLEQAGADFFLIGANTLHKVSDQVEKNSKIPFLNIIDVTGKEINLKGFKKVALLGTRFTMEDRFFQDGLKKYKVDTVVPDSSDRTEIHRVIFEEIMAGKIEPSSRNRFVEIIESLTKQGAQAVVLGCTEIPLLIDNNHVTIPLLDTTTLHAEAAAMLALGK